MKPQCPDAFQFQCHNYSISRCVNASNLRRFGPRALGCWGPGAQAPSPGPRPPGHVHFLSKLLWKAPKSITILKLCLGVVVNFVPPGEGGTVGGWEMDKSVGGWVIIFNATMHRKELLRHPRSTAHRRILLRTCHDPQRFAGYSLRLPANHSASLEIPKGFPGSTAHRRRFPEASHDPQRIAGDSLNQISHGPQRFAGNPRRLPKIHNGSLEVP